jgi:hypothetical protein
MKRATHTLIDKFIQGYECAVATLQRMEGGQMLSTQVKELMVAGGLTEETCRECGVDQYDMEILFQNKEVHETN